MVQKSLQNDFTQLCLLLDLHSSVCCWIYIALVVTGFSFLFFATFDFFQGFSLKNAIFKNNIFKKYVFMFLAKEKLI